MSHTVASQQRPALTPKGLRSLLAASGTSMIGQGVALAAMPLLAASVTRDPVGISLVTVATYAAALVVGLPAGALADRWPHRATMVGADWLRAVLLLGLGLAVIGQVASLPLITLTAFALAAGGCFFDPSAQAMIPDVVGRDPRLLARANGTIWTLDTVGRSLVGPPLGALLFSVAAFAPFLLNAATFVVSALLLLGTPRATSSPRHTGPLTAGVREGVAFVVRDHKLRWLALGMGCYNFAYNVAFSTLVLFALDRLGVSDAGFGLLLATLALGGVGGGWLARRMPPTLAPWAMYAAALAAQGLGWAVVAMASSPWVAGMGLLLVGLVSTVLSVLGGTARQLATPDGMIGRTTAATRTLGIGAAALGGFVGGVIGRLGVATPLQIASATAVLLAVAFVIAARARK